VIRWLGEINRSIGEAFPSAETKAAAIRKQDEDRRATQAKEADARQTELIKTLYGITSAGSEAAEIRAHRLGRETAKTEFDQGRTLFADTVKGKQTLNNNTTDNEIRKLTTQQGFFNETLERAQKHDLAVGNQFIGSTALADNYFGLEREKLALAKQAYADSMKPLTFWENIGRMAPALTTAALALFG